MRKLASVIGLSLILTIAVKLAAAQNGSELLQQAQTKERSGGGVQAEEAIRLYERVNKEFPNDHASAAMAELRLGLIYDKLGQGAKAEQYYQEVVRKYSDQTSVAAEARLHLKASPPESAPDSPAIRVEFPLPFGLNLAHGYRQGVDLSPDGTRIAFAGSINPGSVGADRDRRIYVKSIDQSGGEPVTIAGSEAGYNPVFSPDGKSLAFFSDEIAGSSSAQIIQLKKVSLSGGPPTILFTQQVKDSEPPDNYGVSWGSDGMIVFGSFRDGLKRIPETGGTPELLTRLDTAAGEMSHRLPHFLPDGSGILFTVARDVAYFEDAQIWIYSTRTRTSKLVLSNAVDARFAGHDRLVFARNGNLFSVPFDLKTLSVMGSPSPVAGGDGISHAVRGENTFMRSGAAQFSVSQNGTLVYAPGSIEPEVHQSIVWVNEKGQVTPLGIPPRDFRFARVSPDGQYILFGDSIGDVWLYDIARGTFEPQTTGLDGVVAGEWSPEGTRFVFSTRRGPRTYVKDLNSPGIMPLLSNYIAGAWTSDGNQLTVPGLIYGKRSISIFPIKNPNGVKPYVLPQTQNSLFPALSPDGRWLADSSDESGSYQIYVQPYPGPGPRVLVSSGEDAVAPAWSRDGRQLFYNTGGSMMAVRFNVSDGRFVHDAPAELFNGPYAYNTWFSRSWDIAPDARFIMMRSESAADTRARYRQIFPNTLRLVLNWMSDNTQATISLRAYNTNSAGGGGTIRTTQSNIDGISTQLNELEQADRETFLAALINASDRNLVETAFNSDDTAATQSVYANISDRSTFMVALMLSQLTRSDVTNGISADLNLIVQLRLRADAAALEAFLAAINAADRRSFRTTLDSSDPETFKRALKNSSDRKSVVHELTTALAPRLRVDVTDPRSAANKTAPQFQLSVFDRKGKLLKTAADPIPHDGVISMSPDGTRLAFKQNGLWVVDISSNARTVITSLPTGASAWSPDGTRIAYTSIRDGVYGIYSRSSDGIGDEELLYSSQSEKAGTFQWSTAGIIVGAFMLPNSGSRKLVPILTSVPHKTAFRVSPDGHFIAYMSNESGRNEVWVRPFDPASSDLTSSTLKWQISTQGSVGMVRWRSDGKELYYLDTYGGVVAVEMTAAPEFKAGTPALLFRAPPDFPITGTPGEFADISADGQRFVFPIPALNTGHAPVIGLSSSSDQNGGVTGKWRVEGVPTGPWTIDLKASGTTLTGTVSQSSIPPQEIYNGKIDGNIISFKVKPASDRIVTFAGWVNGNEINFLRDFQLTEGSKLAESDGILGVADLTQFVAKRAP